MAQDAKVEVLLRAYEQNQTWIQFADTKAGVVLAASGVLAGFVLGQLGELDRAPGALRVLALVSLALYGLLQAASFVFAVQVFFPRQLAKGAELHATRHVFPVAIQHAYPRLEDRPRFADDLAGTSVEELEREIACQLHVDSLVSRAKYESLRRSLLALFATFPFAVLALAFLALA